MFHNTERMTMFKFLIPFMIIAFPAFADERATLGSCLAAIAIAEAHDNQWQATFSMDECAVIGGQAIDSGFVLMNPDSSKEDTTQALATLSGKPVNAGVRVRSPRANRHNRPRSQYTGPDFCCLDAPGYVSRNGFYHHYHLYDR